MPFTTSGQEMEWALFLQLWSYHRSNTVENLCSLFSGYS